MKKKDILEFTIGIIFVIIFSYLILQPFVRINLRFLWEKSYSQLVFLFLAFGVIFIIVKYFVPRLSNYSKYLKYIYYIILLPVAIMPILRCYFNIPYIFCRVCPRKCPWGEMKPLIIVAPLIINFDGRFWCFKLCPLGTIQDYQCKIPQKKYCLPKWVKHVRYFFLAFTVVAVFMGIFRRFDLLLPFVNGNYNFVLITGIVAFVIFLLSFVIPRFWCNYFCPIGAVGDMFLCIERFVKNLFQIKSKK